VWAQLRLQKLTLSLFNAVELPGQPLVIGLFGSARSLPLRCGYEPRQACLLVARNLSANPNRRVRFCWQGYDSVPWIVAECWSKQIVYMNYSIIRTLLTTAPIRFGRHETPQFYKSSDTVTRSQNRRGPATNAAQKLCLLSRLLDSTGALNCWFVLRSLDNVVDDFKYTTCWTIVKFHLRATARHWRSRGVL